MQVAGASRMQLVWGVLLGSELLQACQWSMLPLDAVPAAVLGNTACSCLHTHITCTAFRRALATRSAAATAWTACCAWRWGQALLPGGRAADRSC